MNANRTQDMKNKTLSAMLLQETNQHDDSVTTPELICFPLTAGPEESDTGDSFHHFYSTI